MLILSFDRIETGDMILGRVNIGRQELGSIMLMYDSIDCTSKPKDAMFPMLIVETQKHSLAKYDDWRILKIVSGDGQWGWVSVYSGTLYRIERTSVT
jgi:hypothetical protein